MASSLVLEAIDAAKSLRDGDVEDEVSQREEQDRDPGVPAPESCRLGLSLEHQAQEDEEDQELLVELLLLLVD